MGARGSVLARIVFSMPFQKQKQKRGRADSFSFNKA
jgi:hypothetical protein